MPENLPRLALDRGAGLPLPRLAAAHLREYLDKIRLATGDLADEELWLRPAAGTNSIGNLMLHLVGNLSLWVGDGIGGRVYDRDRAGEFRARGSAGRQELLARLGAAVEDAAAVLEGLEPAELDRPVGVQGYAVDVRAALFHATEHMSYHTGQIVYAAKQRLGARGAGLEFYPRHAEE